MSSLLLPASLWRRIAAIIYDSMLIFAIWIIVTFLVLSVFGIEKAQTLDGDRVILDPVYRMLLLAALVTSAFIFFSVFWMKSGQTLGMQVWRIRVQNDDGSAISLKQCALRFFLAPASMLLLGIGYLWMLVDPNSLTLHDKLSYSVVIKVQR